MPKKIRFFPVFSLVVTLMLWSAAFPAIRLALAGFGPLEMAAARFMLAALVFAPFLTRVPFARIKVREWGRFLLCAATGIAGYNLALNIGEQTVKAATASFIVNLVPVFTAILSAFLLQERLRLVQWLGIILAFAGTSLIALGETGGLEISEGLLWVLLAAACQAVFFVLQQPLIARYGAIVSVTLAIVLGALMMVPFLGGITMSWSKALPDARAALVFLGLFPAALAYFTWFHALKHFGPSRASMFLFLVPIFSTLIAWQLLSEMPAETVLGGGGLVLLGVLIFSRGGTLLSWWKMRVFQRG